MGSWGQALEQSSMVRLRNQGGKLSLIVLGTVYVKNGSKEDQVLSKIMEDLGWLLRS